MKLRISSSIIKWLPNNQLLTVMFMVFLSGSQVQVKSDTKDTTLDEAANPHVKTINAASVYTAVTDDPEYSITAAEVLTFSYVDLYHHLDCLDLALNESKQMYTSSMYEHMKDKYTQLSGYIFPNSLPQNQSTFYVGRSQGMGRGLFASRDIAKGERIPFGETTSVVTFSHGIYWKKYVVSLPREMACDVMEWTWTQNVLRENNTKLCVGFGDGFGYVNNGGEENANISPSTWEHFMNFMYHANRDIKEGDELLLNYNIFDQTDKFQEFGLCPCVV